MSDAVTAVREMQAAVIVLNENLHRAIEACKRSHRRDDDTEQPQRRVPDRPWTGLPPWALNSRVFNNPTRPTDPNARYDPNNPNNAPDGGGG